MSDGAALGREFTSRHRWGFTAIGAFIVALAFWTWGWGTPVVAFITPGELPDIPTRFAFTILVPTTFSAFYLIAVFTFGLSGDLAGRQSMYPARLFTLPVTSASLAGWPMLYGTTAIASVWCAVYLVGIRPSGVAVPFWWPLFFLPAVLAWTQAVTWQSYPLRGLRVLAAVLLLTVIDATVLLALHFEASDLLMVALLAPQVPLAFLLARRGVRRARRGDVAAWQVGDGRTAVRERRFPSAAQAQRWFDWQRYGRPLPVWVAILLCVELALLFLDQTPTFVEGVLLMALLTPPAMGLFVAPALGGSGGDMREGFGAFEATRPMTTAAIVSARLRMAIRSALATWAIVAVMIPAAVYFSGNGHQVRAAIADFVAYAGPLRSTIITLLVLALLIVTTWRTLVGSLYIGLSGRPWLIKTSPLVALVALIASGVAIGAVLESPRAQKIIWDGVPVLLVVLATIKLALSAFAMKRLRDRQLISERDVATIAGAWCLAVFVVFAVLVWLAETPILPRHVFLLVAMLVIPLARPSLAPVALAGSRHR